MIEDDPVVPRPNGYKEKPFVQLEAAEPAFVAALPWMARAKARERL